MGCSPPTGIHGHRRIDVNKIKMPPCTGSRLIKGKMVYVYWSEELQRWVRIS